MDKHHVSRVSVGSEVTLALGEVFFSDGWLERVEQDPGKYFVSDGELGDSPKIVAIRLFTLVPL